MLIIGLKEGMIVKNKIWEQVGEFLNMLRCENVKRDTAVEVPRYKDTQEKLEELREKCEAMVYQLPQDQQILFGEWMIKQEDMNSLEGQKAYCQGYVDCILLLSGLGLLRQDLVPEELMKLIHQ